MNNCESNNTQLSMLLNNSFVDQIAEYTSIYQKINQLVSDLDSCCEDKNERYAHIADSLSQLIYNLIDCCNAITHGLDEWIIHIIPGTALTTFEVEWQNHVCTFSENVEPITFDVEWTDGTCVYVEEPLPEETEWENEWKNHVCVQANVDPPAPSLTFDANWVDHICIYKEPPIEPFVDTFDVNWINHICSFDRICDVHGTLDDIINIDQPTVLFFIDYVDHTCLLHEEIHAISSIEFFMEGEIHSVATIGLEGDLLLEFITSGNANGITTTTTTQTACATCDLYFLTTTTTTIP